MLSRNLSKRAREAYVARAVSEALEQRLVLSAALTLSGTQTLSPGAATNISEETSVDSPNIGFEGEASSRQP
jgi:hypothetical protein